MKMSIDELTEEHANQLCGWRYEGEYSVYNFAAWETAIEQNWSITDPEARESDFRSVINEKGELIGFFRMSKDEHGKIDIGLGLKPKYCGHGLGKDFVILITQYALKLYPNCCLYMQVRTFNARAVKCYEACGYKIVLKHRKEYPWGGDEYFLMEYRHA